MQKQGTRWGLGPDGGWGSGESDGIVWYETTLTSHQSGILHSLIFFVLRHFCRELNCRPFLMSFS